MEVDDDMIVVIVGDDIDEGSTYEFPDNVQIKEEILDEDEINLCVEELIKKAETHGQRLDIEIKRESESENHEYDEEASVYDEDYSGGDYDPNDKDYAPEMGEDDYDDNDYIPEEEIDDEEIDSDDEDKGRRRMKMLKPWQRKSYVKELLKQHPELKRDQNGLIETLSKIMKSIKAPPPPQDYYIMNDIMLECVKCGHLSETIPAAGRHFQEKHGKRYLVCFACGVDFRSTTNLYKHEKRCNAPDALIVLKARALSLGRKGRHRPFLPDPNSLPKTKYPCQECTAVFQFKATLIAHERLHRGERPYRCPMCPSAYTSQSALSRHRKKHSDVQYICDNCGRAFKVKAALVAHMDVHLPVRKHGCEECGQRFAQKSAMQLHVNREHRRLPPPCACQICPKRYPRMSLLKAHMKREHGMLLMTRKMFFKSLPTLSETELEKAKVIMKSEEGALIGNDEYGQDAENQCNKDNLSEEVLQYVKMMKNGGDTNDYELVVIKNGEMFNIDSPDIDMEQVKYLPEVQVVEVENGEQLILIHQEQEEETTNKSVKRGKKRKS